MELLSSLLRSVVNDSMNILILLSLLQSKYSKKVTMSVLLLAMGIDVCITTLGYQNPLFAQWIRPDFILFALLCLFLRPLFKVSFAQWLFGYLTVQNANMVVVCLSFMLSRYLPAPTYTDTLLRLLFFGLILFVLRKRLYPVYQQIAEHQVAFVGIALIILLNFGFYFLHGDSSVQALLDQSIPLLLLTLLAIACYLFIFHLIQGALREYELHTQKLKAESWQELLQAELSAQEDFVNLARQTRHDLRHHNALLLDYLNRHDIEGARSYLWQYNETIAKTALGQYCKNPIANAVLRLYGRRAEQNGIAYSVNVQIPTQLSLPAPEVGELLSNLLENACEACERVDSPDRFTTLNVRMEDCVMILELCNMVSGQTEFDQDGLPVSQKKDGGIGTKSVNSIVQKYGGMLSFKQQNGVFYTRILLPAEHTVASL